jgi:hypothetical protein
VVSPAGSVTTPEDGDDRDGSSGAIKPSSPLGPVSTTSDLDISRGDHHDRAGLHRCHHLRGVDAPGGAGDE